MPEETEIGQVGVDKVGEDAAEHAKHHADANPWMRWLALSTALFAVIASIAALKSGHYADEALLHANEATLKQAEASDEWALYQAKGIRAVTRDSEASILEALKAPEESFAKARQDAERYRKEQDDLQREARALTEERASLERESTTDLQRHQRFAYVVTTLQVAIGLSAVAALVARRALWIFALLIGAGGSAYFIVTLAQGM